MSVQAMQLSPQAWGMAASVGAGLATAIGSLFVFSIREHSAGFIAVLLGLASGVMLAASIFSLALPAVEMTLASGSFLGAAGLGLGLSFLAGIGILGLADRYFPQERLAEDHQAAGFSKKQAWLLVFAMALHNFPEGLAVGVGFSAPSLTDGFTITTGVAIQNLPEGLLTALALVTAHYQRMHVFSIVALTGLVEVLAGFIGVVAVTHVRGMVPATLAFSAGAMLYVVFSELLPHSFKREGRVYAIAAGLVGFVLTSFLDQLIG